MNHSQTRRAGFTIIELMLSMAFISVLLIVIMMTVMQITTIYNKGITMREINQAGRAISDDLGRAIASSTVFDVSGGADNRYIKQTGGGRLCVGKYSYVWNYGITSDQPNKDVDGKAVRLVKIPDADAKYCKLAGPIYPAVPVNTEVVDLLKSGDRNLVIQAFSISQAGSSSNDATTGQAIYTIKFVVGTNDRELLVDSVSCKPPADTGDRSGAYCAVNRFEITARAGNQAKQNE